MLKKCVLTFLELNWNKRLGHNWIKLNICHHMPMSSTQLQNRSSHVLERTRTSSKCQKMKNARAKRAKILFSIDKYANLWGGLLPSSSWLLKLPFKATSTTTATKTPQICIFDNKKNSILARFARAFFIFWHFWTSSRSFYDVKWPVLQLCGRLEHMMTNIQFCLLISQALVPI